MKVKTRRALPDGQLRRKLCLACWGSFETTSKGQQHCSACEVKDSPPPAPKLAIVPKVERPKRAPKEAKPATAIKPRHYLVGEVVGAGWVVLEVITEPYKDTRRCAYRTRCPLCGGAEKVRPAHHLNTVSHCRGCANRARPRRTQCKSGHAFDEANTRRTRRGARECKRCHIEHQRRKRRARGCRENKTNLNGHAEEVKALISDLPAWEPK